MQVEQIYQIVNTISQEVLGESAVVNEDLSNIVEIGDSIANLGSAAFENYTRTLIDHIGKRLTKTTFPMWSISVRV